jgi:hypothetical protein
MTEGDIGSFHGMLMKHKRVAQLQDIGRRFLKCLWDCEDFPEHLWESRTTEELCRLDVNRLMQLLVPFEPIEDNISKTPDWRRPEGWDYEWPIQPDRVMDDTECEFCNDRSCDCITTYFKSDITVGACGKKGRGLLAGVPGRGTVVFKKGEPLGRLVGELVAPGTYANGWAFNLLRSDISPARPYVAQIYSREKGNAFRLVNHACRDSASAHVQCETISGIYAPIFYARRDLNDGDEITVDWGEGYLEGEDCFCDSCESSAQV